MLESHWLQLMKRLSLPQSLSTYTQLCAAYTETHRFYHTLQHINACLIHLNNTERLATEPDHIALALWFHDAIYQPFSTNNEQQSADWAQRFLVGLNASPALIDNVYRLIMATAHNSEPQHDDERLIVDIDLTILGAPPTIFEEFEQNIRNEYKRVPTFIYKSKRKKILQQFLARPRLYYFDYFFDMFETQARENLNNVISKLN
ncbi:HD domain-containing protein [Saccharophagus degradans]|uniref:N-methyl-D-aspartate receptor NMDAR2C subunit n=1 Tax=Saccharophagus degradans (strain 2-40 / ATCC 43961 / DSM 17024) TaxID=203122 RepID=Q21DQ0_SACD2|nr:hypothetical protein [Saccharophagus degradans]ABD83179.1 conserved hypothetical protein [Saccharophagus degradans 2-40]